MRFNGVWKEYWESIKEGEEQELASQVAQDDLFGESSTDVPDEHYMKRKVASRLVSYIRTVSSR
ncbi:hypothetical protein AN958_10413 [Leucoagaricus sp. SymC.cos]|nr:hypothetical protein AN958_10413 [Leucoagaricus sp. SymC.cos]